MMLGFILLFFSGAIIIAGLKVGLIATLICLSVVGCIWLFIYVEYRNYNTEQGRKQYEEMRRKQKEYEDNYGIIEHDDDD